MPKAWHNGLVDMLTSRFGAPERNSKWDQHVRLFQPRRALPPDEPEKIRGMSVAKKGRAGGPASRHTETPTFQSDPSHPIPSDQINRPKSPMSTMFLIGLLPPLPTGQSARLVGFLSRVYSVDSR